MIASNFFRKGFNVLYPQINWAGPLPGYVGTEFPLVPYLAALLYVPFGEHFYLGRLVSITLFVPTIPLFYLLVRRYFGRTTAWFALFFYLASPLSIYYSRTFMPESAMMFFSIAGVFFFSRWVDRNTTRDYLLALCCTAFALLVKIPAAIIGLPMAYLAWRKYGRGMLRQVSLWAFALIATVPSVLWYSHALSLARNHYPFHAFWDPTWIGSSGPGIFLSIDLYRTILLNVTASLLTPLGLFLAAGGAVLGLKKRPETYLFHWWALGFLIFLVLGLPGHRHEYYQLPLVPVAAAFAGVFCTHLLRGGDVGLVPFWRSKRRVAMVLALVSVLLVSSALVGMRYHSEITHALYVAGKIADKELPRSSLILAADWNNPVLIQASGRNGWHFAGHGKFVERRVEWSVALLEDFRSQGAQYFVAPVRPPPSQQKPSLLRSIVRYVDPPRQYDFLDSHPGFRSYLESRYSKVLENEFVAIYDLRRPKANSGGTERESRVPDDRRRGELLRWTRHHTS